MQCVQAPTGVPSGSSRTTSRSRPSVLSSVLPCPRTGPAPATTAKLPHRQMERKRFRAKCPNTSGVPCERETFGRHVKGGGVGPTWRLVDWTTWRESASRPVGTSRPAGTGQCERGAAAKRRAGAGGAKPSRARPNLRHRARTRRTAGAGPRAGAPTRGRRASRRVRSSR